MLDSPLVQLTCGDARLTLCPEFGAAIARFDWRGRDILRPASNAAIADQAVREMGAYALVPNSNRIGNASLIVGDRQYSLRRNFAPEPHAIHGFGWQRPWCVIRQSGATAKLALQHLPDEDWPFACAAVQTVRLLPDALHLALGVRNTDRRTMPAGLGFHPFFPVHAGLHLQTAWQGMWRTEADRLPSELIAVPAGADFSERRPVAGWRADNCFTGWNRRAILDYGSHCVRIEASRACRQIVCFAPGDGRNFIALEPVTTINNAFALAARGVPDTGTKMLAPGEGFSISMRLVLQSGPPHV
jgi:aldose 1-epimerase